MTFRVNFSDIEGPPAHLRADFFDLLHQDEWWQDRWGSYHKIEDMSPDYCMNVLNLINRFIQRMPYPIHEAAEASYWRIVEGWRELPLPVRLQQRIGEES